MPEPLAVKLQPDDPDPPLFVRRVARARIWVEALQTKRASDASDVLYEQDENVSLWRVSTDEELRRIAIAINESRDSFREMLDLLPILPTELEQVGVRWDSDPGDTSCPAAGKLHFNAEMNNEARLKLL